jgi:hypothetical protein
MTDQMKVMHSNGTLPQTLAETARTLLAWLEGVHPEAPRPTEKSLKNTIRSEYNRLSKAMKSTRP